MATDEAVLAYAALDKNEKQDFLQAAGLKAASSRATDVIWILIVGGVIIALLITVASFAVAADSTNLLAVFTAVIGFLGGLVTPSPVNRGQ